MENNKFRFELKYRCSAAQLALIQSRLHVLMPYDTHTRDGSYSIRSLYFDSIGDRCFFENENGTDPREKYRIRIYNADGSRISLECKRKERGKVCKTSCLLTRNDYDAILSGGSLSSPADQPALLRKFTVALKTELFRPKVIVEYDRTPFVYRVGNVRITLDKNIRSSCDFGGFFRQDLPTRPILPSGQHLLEVKYDELLPDHIKNVLELGELRQSTFSKYYLCRKYAMGGIL